MTATPVYYSPLFLIIYNVYSRWFIHYPMPIRSDVLLRSMHQDRTVSSGRWEEVFPLLSTRNKTHFGAGRASLGKLYRFSSSCLQDRTALRSGAEIRLLSLWLCVPQSVSFTNFLLAPTCPSMDDPPLFIVGARNRRGSFASFCPDWESDQGFPVQCPVRYPLSYGFTSALHLYKTTFNLRLHWVKSLLIFNDCKKHEVIFFNNQENW